MDQIQFWINEILFDGHGYNLFVGLDVQSAAVGRINIDQSQQSQVNWLILGASALKDSELGKFGLKPSVWKPQVMAARSLPGMSRCGIVILDGVPHLYNPVPYGDGLVIPEAEQELNHVQQWLELRKPELLTILEDCKNPSHSGIFDQGFKVNFPKGYMNRKPGNPYYEAFSKFVNEYKSVR